MVSEDQRLGQSKFLIAKNGVQAVHEIAKPLVKLMEMELNIS